MKYVRAEQATVDNMAHAHCMTDNYSYKAENKLKNTDISDFLLVLST